MATSSESVQTSTQHVLRLDALAQAATDAIAAANAAHWSATTELAARNTLREHFLASFDFLHGDAWQSCLSTMSRACGL